MSHFAVIEFRMDVFDFVSYDSQMVVGVYWQ